jgi:serine/threonine protein kinase
MGGGDLFERVVANTIDEEEARRITRMVLQAVEYLHNNDIAHRDLKVLEIATFLTFSLKI